MSLVYLASPYSQFPHGRKMAFIAACKKAAELMLDGNTVFCPIAHSHIIEEIGMDEVMSGDWWLEQDFAILKHCDKVVVYRMEGWEGSYGVTKEIAYALENNIPVFYID